MNQRILAFTIASFLIFSPRSHAGPPTWIDLVHNGGLERGMEGWSFSANGAAATGALDTATAHSGKTSFKVSNASGFAPNVYARFVQTITGLQPFTTYEASCWVKGKKAGLNWFGGGPGWYTRVTFPKGDFDWHQVVFEVNTGADADNYELMIATESATEALWVDDVRFQAKRVDQPAQIRSLNSIQTNADQQEARVARLTNEANVDVCLAKAIARRFIAFSRTNTMSIAWIRFQQEEVNQVLDEAEKLQRAASPILNWTELNRPAFEFGYGHFDSVIDDLPNFRSLGASLIQDGRAGPSAMTPDFKLSAEARHYFAGYDTAARDGIQVDFLLSPHYFPTWAATPDVVNNNIGFLHFNIDSPKAKDVLNRWAAVVHENTQGKSALHSICLANEPVYTESGRDALSRPMFLNYLRQIHTNLEEVNALYGTSYTNFDDIPTPANAMPSTVPQKRAFYDWVTFNNRHFADWHHWLDTTVKSNGLIASTHSKIMVFQTLDRDKAGWGVDPELICNATDWAGCDAYAFPGGAWAYDWLGHEFYYDLLHSFRGQPVFNSENHLIPDGSPRTHLPMNHSRAVLWQDGLHHETSTTIWVWQMTAETSGGLDGSIYFRPANIFGAGRAMFDLNRLTNIVQSINQMPARVALLYSPPSMFWDETYKSTMFALYTALTFMGEPVTFVSERQLAGGSVPTDKWIICPSATHVWNTTKPALADFQKHGGRVLLVGPNNLANDEYDRPYGTNAAAFATMTLNVDDAANSSALRRIIKPSPVAELRQSLDGQPCWGVEYRAVKLNSDINVAMINFNKEPRKVMLPAWKGYPAEDLLSGERVDTRLIILEPMLPRVIHVHHLHE